MFSAIAELFAVEKARLWHGLSRSMMGLFVAVLAVLAALEGLGILLIGVYTSLIHSLRPWEAGVLLGGGVIFLAAVALAVIASVVSRRGRTRPPPMVGTQPYAQHAAVGDTPALLLRAAAADLISKANLRMRDVALAALVAGLVLGASPNLRRHLFQRKPKA